MDYLETEHGNSIATRNQRFVAIHSFFRYISIQNPEYIFISQQILAIPEKKKEQKLVKHFETDQVRELLAAPDTHTIRGRRDQALLCLLYDSGCRVQELADIKVCDVRLTVPAQVTVTGKGRKTRTIPLTDDTKEIIAFYMKENRRMRPSKQDTPLFYNCHGNKLTRQGITYILKKYTEPLGLGSATPHILRRSKAMHMTEADINPIHIRDFLGHTDLKVTQIYSKTGFNMPEKGLDVFDVGSASKQMAGKTVAACMGRNRAGNTGKPGAFLKELRVRRCIGIIIPVAEDTKKCYWQVDIVVQNFLKRELFALAPDIQFLGIQVKMLDIDKVIS